MGLMGIICIEIYHCTYSWDIRRNTHREKSDICDKVQVTQYSVYITNYSNFHNNPPPQIGWTSPITLTRVHDN